MPQRKLKDIQRLLSAFPPVSGEPALILHNYLTAVDDFEADLVEEAVTLYIKGGVPGFDGRFAPTPPMLAGGCRLATEKRARAAYLEGYRTPRLAPPDIVKTPEQRAKAKAQVEALIQTIGAVNLHETTEETKRRRESWEKTNAMFQPPMDDRSVMERLVKPRYSVGAPESDEAAA